MPVKRRDFLKLSAAAVMLKTLPAFAKTPLKPQRVVVVGGGYAGATAAKYIRLWGRGSIEVTVVEPSPHFISCPLSNLVLGGSKTIEELTFSYDMLAANHGIQWVRDEMIALDPVRKKVSLARGELAYDRLILAPGVDFIYAGLDSLSSPEAQLQIPHAWKAGPQTTNLKNQLRAMPEDGVFVMTVPLMPYRCPPGPYERASQVASYFRQHKPHAKVIILDANPDIVSKGSLFRRAWAELYPGMIDYRPNSALTEVNVAMRTVKTEFETVKSDVLNVIPSQRAGRPAQMSGTVNVDRRWCGVDFVTYESTAVPGVHVIGDAVSAALPKSAHMATAQAHVCANAVVSLLNGAEPDPAPVFANTCYSFVDDRMAMHVANVYRYDALKKVMLPALGGGLSEQPSEQEGNYAHYWAQNIWSDALT